MIPSPPVSSINLGPLTIHIYGIIIAFAIITCYTVALKLGKKKNITEKEIDQYFFTSLPVAFVGARFYHVLTNWGYYSKNIILIPAIWNGGLGMFGGVVSAIGVIYFISKKQKRSFLQITDLLAVVVPLGHAIGRWGNYFNQELFGKPTTLPWGLYINRQNRPTQYKNNETFHPTFLYESVLNIVNFILLHYLYTKKKLPTGSVAALYLINYGIIRFIIELVKIDPDVSAQIGLLRIPQYMSLLFILAGILVYIYSRSKHTKNT